MRTIDVIIVIAMVALLILAIFVVLPWRVRRAAKGLVRTLRNRRALVPKSAITPEELGIKKRSMWTLRPKDFKQDALDLLISGGVVQVTGENKLYLSEEKLMESKIGRPESYYG